MKRGDRVIDTILRRRAEVIDLLTDKNRVLVKYDQGKLGRIWVDAEDITPEETYSLPLVETVNPLPPALLSKDV